MVSAVASLSVGANGVVTAAAEQADTIVIRGTLTAALDAGSGVQIVLPSGQVQSATVNPDGISFSATLTGLQAPQFGAGGSIAAYVEDATGNPSAATTASFYAESRRTILPVSATPMAPLTSTVSAPSLSQDGSIVAFEAAPIGSATLQRGVYLENLTTGVVTLVAANAKAPSLSPDGQSIAYVASDGFEDQVWLKNLATGIVTLLSAPPGSNGSTGGGGNSEQPRFAADGTVVFNTSASDLINGVNTFGQVLAAKVSGGLVALSIVSRPDPTGPGAGAPAGGLSSAVSISADGSTAVFLSSGRNLLGAGDPHTAALDGSVQVYVKALRDNPVTGQRAGTVTLVSGLPGGAIARGTNATPAISGNGRYVVFASTAANLVSGLTAPAGTQEIYLADVLTGAVSLVSDSAAGVAANFGAFAPQISVDGRTVVFFSAANLLPAADPTAPNVNTASQTYAKDLVTGAVTLLSTAGYIPADSSGFSASLSGNGATVVFSSTADNLVPGGGPMVTYSAPRGFLTSVPTTPALTITAPAGTAGSSTLTLTGTIDAADATRPIVLADAADPGFSATTTVVVPSADPETDTWSSAVTFTSQGSQTVTATVPGTAASASATLTVAYVPTVTLNPVGGTGALAIDPLSIGATTFTGTAASASGSTLSLFLHTAGGTLLPLGTATVGADGNWSVAVPDAQLGANGSGSYAVVATSPNAGGTTAGASAPFTVTVAPVRTLYDYSFTFADGSFYTGTVAADSSLGYTAGRTIKSTAGQYVIGGADGLTAQAAGTVTLAAYYDISTATTYTATGGGSAGLGSETGTIAGPAGKLGFGLGSIEARTSAATAYSFDFIYNDGSLYTGTVAAGAGTSYTAGQVLSTGSGAYHIMGVVGATSDALGTVRTSAYYDRQTSQTLMSTLGSQGLASGVSGLGSETDSVSGAARNASFGLSGLDKVALRLTQTFIYQYAYTDGSNYLGFVTDDGSYGYHVGQHIYDSKGSYYVYGTATPVQGQVGYVYVLTYHDAIANGDFTPYLTTKGEAAGTTGLGSEVDITQGDSGNQIFGTQNHLEAKQDPFRLFAFTFTYKDGSYYTGDVVDDGSVGYYVGETMPTVYGHYKITYYDASPLAHLTVNQVFVGHYFDVTTNYTNYIPTKGGNGGVSGTGGLGSELDTITGPAGTIQFGRGGEFEAKEAPNPAFYFHFYYKDGSNYTGTVTDTGSYHYAEGEKIPTDYGYYLIGVATFSNDPNGYVRVYTYHDSTNGADYTPDGYKKAIVAGGAGLGSEVDTTTGPSGAQKFGINGLYEAKQAPNTMHDFQFFYPDGSFYVGFVVDNAGTGVVNFQSISTSYGYYFINGSAGATFLAAGSVYVSKYFDATTANDPATKGLYVPYFYTRLPPAPDGSAGLGSEQDAILGPPGVATFGLGGKLEAKLSSVTAYSFTFRYTDGSFYSGTVAVAGLTSYLGQVVGLGQTITTPYGYYYLSGATQQSSLAPGTIQVSSYFAIDTGKFYTPIHYSEGKAAGTGGLGSEADLIVGTAGLVTFGHGGALEAKPGSFSITSAVLHYAFDGPLSGATVGYLDPTSRVIQIDPAQPTTVTDGEGRYVLAAGVGPVVLTGGTDTATGLPFKGVLESAGTGSALSPITTLIEAVAAAEGDVSDNGVAHAGSVVSAALALPTGIDLTNYLPTAILDDPASSAQDVATAEAVYRAGAALLDIETLIDAGGGSSQAAIGAAATALAHGSLTDLTGYAALAEYGGMPAPDELAAKLVFTAADDFLSQQLQGVTEPTLIVGLISGASIALQRDAINALQAAGTNLTGVANSFAAQVPALLATDDQLALTDGVACYCHGTTIQTDQGSVPIESLAAGMRVVTWDGPALPIRWIGRRSYAGRFLAGRRHLLPVVFQAGCLGAGLPYRDLRVSPLHAMFLDGILVPAIHLVNGTSILQERTAARVDYIHIELDHHDIIFAEGAAAETFLDDDSRGMFHNASEFTARHPAQRANGRYCAPRVESGAGLEVIRCRLDGIASALRQTASPQVAYAWPA